MIDQLILCSLYFELFLNEGADKPLAIGTGFTMKANGKGEWFLVTNWHCVTGRHPDTNEPLSGIVDPEIMRVYFHSKGNIGQWVTKEIKLIDDGHKKWIEHPKGRSVDVVAIRLHEDNQIELHNFSKTINGNDLLTYPSDDCSIIGYPNGLTAGGKFPIWKTGHIASDYDLNWDGKPMFLIDATTRTGMSGSPVVCIKEGLCRFERNNLISGRFIKFLGVYSGRIDQTTEIGRVWKPQALIELLNSYYS